MSNPYFQFKQFTIWQDQSAMKVGTLGCILGAYSSHENPKRILDIGAGTGLLALMLAQRFPEADIEAIEIEEEAYRQACINAEKSKWKDRIKLFHGDFLSFDASGYDLIVTNPPFFEKNLKSPDEKTNLARHNDQLPFTGFIENSMQLLNENGVLYILLPPFEMKKMEKLARDKGLFIIRSLGILNYPGQSPKACICAFSHQPEKTKEEQLVIRNADKTLTPEYISLLKAFYLHF